MERLSFSSKFGYNASEAAIHMARYQLAAAYCKDKRVLDIACGEGYGSYALKRFGAASVEGVDNVPVAIETARRLFGTPGINYQVGDAEQVDGLFPPGEFDVVVSLETIEHLRDPAAFLRALKRVAKEDAVIIVSCPNDHWYYPGADQSNPFHVRKYAFEEFRSLTTEVLGAGAVWGYGVPMVGFGNVMDDDIAGRDQMLGQAMMLDFTVQASAITLPQRQLANVGPRNCSYFVGIWGGGGGGLRSAAVSPISMDQYANLVSWETAATSPRRVHELETAIENASLELASISRDIDRSTGEYATSATDQSDSSRREGDAIGHLSSKIAGLRGTIAQLHGTIAQLRDDLREKSRQADAHRIQAFALAKELDIVMGNVAELSAEQARLQADPHSALARLKEENLALERQVNTLLQGAPATAAGLGDQLKQAGKIRIIQAGRAMKPYLPQHAKSLAQRIARKLNL